MGRINQRRQHISSTRKEIKSDMEYEVATPVSTGIKTDLVYAMVIDQGQFYTDLTGIFSLRLSKERWYTMVLYCCYCNCVLPLPMKGRPYTEWLKAYGGVHQ
jgi:hypothetical protein